MRAIDTAGTSMLYTILIGSVFLTAVMSGVLGMAGGIVLMAILVAALPVTSAMVLHGTVQAFSNGSRAWFLRKHVAWRVLPGYVAGAALAVAGFAAALLVPDPAVVLILVGAMPWIARAVPLLGATALQRIDVSRPVTGVVCGLTVTTAQLLAGASGPLLDLFYLHSPLNRHQVVASKALTQTIGHVLKVVYYGALTGVATSTTALPPWLYAAAILAAIAGARIGTRLLDRIPEAAFRSLSGWVILALGTACMLDGLRRLLQATPI